MENLEKKGKIRNTWRENGNFSRKNVFQKSWSAKNFLPPKLGARSPPVDFKVHVARTVSRFFRQLRLLKGCIKSLPFEAARAAVAAFVTSHVDRYNSLLVGAPKYLLDCLQSVLNAAARLLCNRRKYDHVTPLLRDVLHWLPVPFRVEFKICLLVYKSLHGAAPGY